MHRLWYDGTTKDLRWLRAINDDIGEVDLRRLSVLVPRNATAPHRRHLDFLASLRGGLSCAATRR